LLTDIHGNNPEKTVPEFSFVLVRIAVKMRLRTRNGDRSALLILCFLKLYILLQRSRELWLLKVHALTSLWQFLGSNSSFGNQTTKDVVAMLDVYKINTDDNSFVNPHPRWLPWRKVQPTYALSYGYLKLLQATLKKKNSTQGCEDTRNRIRDLSQRRPRKTNWAIPIPKIYSEKEMSSQIAR